MAENQQKKKQENRVCEKIFRAVTSPVRTVSRISTKPSPSHPAEAAARVKFAETVIARVETTVKTDARFTDYIKKAKLKIRAMTNLGDMIKDDASETSDDHYHHVPISHVGSSERSSDHFSDYINKAKMRLRSSSTITRANPTYDSFN